jgi:cytochrome P450
VKYADQLHQAIVGINPWVAHRNASVFGANATHFVPERWDPQCASSEELAAMSQYYLPFGAGARTCIGKHISHLEMVKLIPELVRRYDFKCISDELDTSNRWFVKPRGILFQLRQRN